MTEVSAAELTFGQPLHETHPHLIEAGECEFVFYWALRRAIQFRTT